MNPRVSRSQRPGEQGDRVPDRQDRRQARRRLPARRDPQRHHPRDPRLLRADDRLRRHQDPPLGVREVPRGRRRPDHPDEVRRRGHGDRPDLPRVVPEGPARAWRSAGSASAATRRTSGGPTAQPTEDEIKAKLATPNAERVWYIRYALLAGMTIEQIHALTGIDPWFLANIRELVELEGRLRAVGEPGGRRRRPRSARRSGTASPTASSRTSGTSTEAEVRRDRQRRGIEAVFKLVDTCAAEFEAVTPYYYSTYEDEDEARVGDRPRVVILGGGPNRIGQGIEFDYCCCQAAFALRADGLRGRHGQLEPRDRQHRLRHLRPPLLRAADGRGRAQHLRARRADRRDRPVRRPDPAEPGQGARGGRACRSSARAPRASTWPRTASGSASSSTGSACGRRPTASATELRRGAADRRADRLPGASSGPSFVLGGRAMEIVYDEPSLARYMTEAVEASPEHPVLIDKFLEDASEVDVDAVCDGKRTIVGGVMEHIEEAGIHSGDSACAIPPFSLAAEVVAELEAADLRPGRGAGRPRTDEHPVRRQGWRGLRPGGQPAGLADGAVRLEGHRPEPGAGRRRG